MYHYAGNNPVRYTDPDGRVFNLVAQALVGAAIGATTGVVTNMLVQITTNIISGQSFSAAIDNIDIDSVKSAALGGAVTGALTGGLNSVNVIRETISVCKAAKVVVNASTNMAGTAVGTIVDNKLHKRNPTDNLGRNLMVSGLAGGISGMIGKTGSKVIMQNSDGVRQSSIQFLEILDRGGTINTFSSTTKNEVYKEFSIGIMQEILSE